MARYKATIAYDGSGFNGYQIQPNGRTVQAEIEKALQKMHKGEHVRITASGRTDTGVHAKGQVIHFDSPLAIEPANYRQALQVMTPLDISFLTLERVSDDFHARFQTKSKEYRYVVKRSEVFDPFSRHFALHYPHPLDLEKMRAGAEVLIGEHDFSSFCSAKTERENKIRTIYEIEIMEIDHETIVLRYKGNGFLYNMVRILTGSLLDVGNNKISVSELKKALEARERTALSSKTVAPQGLYLWKVAYETRETM
ncbi:tRNA pseudouridine(38-40) synthase TruA [Listeria costaricensis]|uniref:tRNA pseudouridine(38-40) synthase TruA n=1 Tax=Listeria costaricensis TaxID=2026604 RepID=UPI000C0729D8|nr:tRNA pseudouridine(38-40) synthase TruA [Listeria costaricensis]